MAHVEIDSSGLLFWSDLARTSLNSDLLVYLGLKSGLNFVQKSDFSEFCDLHLILSNHSAPNTLNRILCSQHSEQFKLKGENDTIKLSMRSHFSLLSLKWLALILILILWFQIKMVASSLSNYIREKDQNGDKIGSWADQMGKGKFRCKWCLSKPLAFFKSKAEVLKHSSSERHTTNRMKEAKVIILCVLL